MGSNIDDKELDWLVDLSERKLISYWHACSKIPALVAEVRRLRRNYECSEKSLQRHEHMVAELMEKVEAWEWFDEVRIYKPWNEHPNWEACGNSSKRGKIFDRAVDEYKLIYKAAREAVHADRE